jgi:hypothetical protein
MLYILVCSLAAWLHVVCGLSRVATTHVLKMVEVIIYMVINVTYASPRSVPVELSVPHDVRTAMSALSIKPKIIRSICCPKCFQRYPLTALPEICSQ